MVGSCIESYHPVTSNIAFIAAAAEIAPYLKLAEDTISIYTISQHIPLMALLKVATLRMISSDC